MSVYNMSDPTPSYASGVLFVVNASSSSPLYGLSNPGPHLLVLQPYYSKHIDSSFTYPTPLEGTLTSLFLLLSFLVECRSGVGSVLHGNYSKQVAQ